MPMLAGQIATDDFRACAHVMLLPVTLRRATEKESGARSVEITARGRSYHQVGGKVMTRSRTRPTSTKRAPRTSPRRPAKPARTTRPKRPRQTRPIPPDAQWLTQAQVAVIFQTSPSVIRKWTRDGRLKAEYFGDLPRYGRAAIDAMKGIPPKPPDPQAAERAATVRDIMDKLGGSER